MEVIRTPNVVLLHGITGSRRIFDGLTTRLQAPPLEAQVLSFDLLGFGENQTQASTFCACDQLEFISRQIAAHFGDGPLVLIGHSLGGVLAAAWAIAHQDRVSALVLLNTPLGTSREDIIESLSTNHWDWAGILLHHRRWAHAACFLLRGLHVSRCLKFLKPSYVPDEVFDDYVRHSWRSLSRTFELILLEIPGRLLLDQARTFPILNLFGTEDRELSRRTVENSNVSNIALLGGHLSLLEHPDQVATAIMEFLSRHALAQGSIDEFRETPGIP